MRRRAALAVGIFSGFLASNALAVTDTYNLADPASWLVPAGVSSITVTVWGGGGGGGGNTNDSTPNSGGAGGAGGTSCTRTISVQQGDSITWTIGGGGAGAVGAATAGSATTLQKNSSNQVSATGGGAANGSTAGTAGSTTSCTSLGGTAWTGGAGGARGGTASNRGGGGGGGSGTTTANGGGGGTGAAGVGGAGGTGTGTGGTGGVGTNNGVVGNVPGGGGGGGGGNTSSVSTSGAAGANGQVRITYSTCGNGSVESGEQCDDTNLLNGDCCSSTCQYEANGSSCDADGLYCTENDTCNGAGVCNAGPARTCDDANVCTDDSCNEATDSCDHGNNTNPCGDPSDTVCDNPDSCSGGSCQPNYESASTECRADAGACDVAESCDGAGACPADGFEPDGTACGDGTDSVCDNPDTCSAGSCATNPEPVTTECRADTGECDVAENCDGAGACPADAFELSGTACGDGTDTECSNPDTCDGANNCLANHEANGTACGDPSDTVCDNADTCNAGSCATNPEPVTTECRADTGDCDVAESCDGAGACPVDAFEPNGTACGDSSDSVCDNPDTCDGSNSCQANYEPVTTECRTDTGECDVAENCDGAGACPADAFELSGTACGDGTDTECSNPDTCDGANNCLANHEANGTACGDPSDTVCDNADTCSAGSCATNPEPGTTECRADAGECDVAENCDGAGACPADAFEPNGTACGDPSDTVCDNADTCSAGSCATNPEPGTTECRADAGECDVAENCDGAGACPADAFEPNGTACGDGTDSVCDNPDTCSAGSCATNPEPGTTECRADTGECDVAENCDGAGACPADVFEPSGTACGDPSDTVCDNADTCDGANNCQVNNEPGTTECRADAGECDVAENCDGAGACPADAFELDGTACGDGTDSVCDNPDTCNAGSCATNPEPGTTECRADTGECDVAENCDGAGACPADAFEPSGTACGDPSDTVCDNADTCDGANACQANNEPGSTVCRASGGTCDSAETCDGAGSCPADVLTPNGTPCDDGDVCSTGETCTAGTCGGGSLNPCDDGDLCTVDSCDEIDGCVNSGEPVDPLGCYAPTQYSIDVKNSGDPEKNSLKWSWKKGEAVALSELGTPTTTTDYALCLFDRTGGTPTLVGSYVLPANSLWSVNANADQIKFQDKAGANDGITQMRGRASLSAGKPSMSVRARGLNFTLPTAVSGSEYFDLDGSLTVQLVNSEGACWSSDFTTSHVKKNTPQRFQAAGR